MGDVIDLFPNDDGLMDCPDCGGLTFVLFNEGPACVACKKRYDLEIFYSDELEFDPEPAA